MVVSTSLTTNQASIKGISEIIMVVGLLGSMGKVSCTSSLEVRIWALQRSLTIILEKGLPKITIESDSSVAIKLCNEGPPSNHARRHIVEEARTASRTNSTISHIFRQANQTADYLARPGSQQEEELIGYQQRSIYCWEICYS